MMYHARNMLRWYVWYVLISVAIISNFFAKNGTQSFAHMSQRNPSSDTTICKVYTKEEGSNSNMISTANCIGKCDMSLIYISKYVC